MPTFAFFLGNAPELASAELSAVCSRHHLDPKITNLGPIALLTSDTKPDTQLLEQLGGTVKVGEVVGELPKERLSDLDSTIVTILENSHQAKIDFGISLYLQNSKVNLIQLTKSVKSALAGKIKVRFVLPKFPSQELSSVLVKKQNITEISVVENAQNYILIKTFWVQDFEDWGKRDYGRPQASGHIGMLPPKVARMMVNLALSHANSNSPVTIFDPFSGAGTILAESLVLEAKVIGTDLDPKQVTRTLENLGWLSQAYTLSGTYKVFRADATKVSASVAQKVDAIVTEPDLGPNNPQSLVNLDTVQKLANLYLAGLSDWTKILAENGSVVMVLPSFGLRENRSNSSNLDLVKTVIDKAKLMGYSLVAGPFQYFRPQAVVKRNIVVFNFTGSPKAKT